MKLNLGVYSKAITAVIGVAIAVALAGASGVFAVPNATKPPA